MKGNAAIIVFVSLHYKKTNYIKLNQVSQIDFHVRVYLSAD